MKNNSVEVLQSLIKRLTFQQKLLIGLTVIITIILLGAMVMFVNQPSFSALYSNLSQEDASRVLDYLSTQKIPYQIEDNGNTIKIPKEKVYETRMALAGKGIPASGIIGYEIFDKNTMGMSEFMQKLNFKRALEGELARTIMQQEGVEGVRVHIVLPQRSIFKDEEKLPTASVVLKLKNNYSISKNNMSAIVNLVSGSVEGLLPSNVTLIDTKGRILTKEFDSSPIAFSSAKQYEMKQSVENYLAQKAQVILDNILGYGNSMIQVNADLNFDQVERTMHLFDPESQVAISEQNIKTENTGRNTNDSSEQISQNNTVNYEVNKTIQHVVEGSGNILRLSVAVVVNHQSKEVVSGEKTEVVLEPRSDEQMQKLEEIVKNAVGIDAERKDKFSIVNIPFETKPFEDMIVESPSFINSVEDYTDLILLIVSIIGAIFILKGLMNKLKSQKIILGNMNVNVDGELDYLPAPSSIASAPEQKAVKKSKKNLLPIGDIEDEISEEAIRKKNQQAKISNYVAKNPVDTAKLINSWLHEDEIGG